MAVSTREKVSFQARRFLNFLSVFRRNRRGMLGVVILLFFFGMAVFGPSLTPHSPVEVEALAGELAAPLWLRYFPGGDYLSENVVVVDDPGFNTVDALEEWTFTSTSNGQNVFLQHVSSMGDPFGSGPGCLAITFRREDVGGEGFGSVYFNATKQFESPFEGPPKFFEGFISISVEGISDLQSDGKPYLDVPVEITVFVAELGNETIRYPLWHPDVGTVETNLGAWVYSKASPESRSSDINSRAEKLRLLMFGPENARDPMYDAVKTIFNSSRLPGSYVFGVSILFKDFTSPHKVVETTVYIDDLSFRTFGTSFGLLGTDQFGRDIWTQLLWGSRVSLYIGLLASILGIVIGLIVGLAAGYLGKLMDETLMRFTDMLLVIPMLPLLIVLVAVLGTSLDNLILLLGLLGWMGFARLIRSQVLSLKERPFIEAAKAVGAGKTHIILRHVVPNVMNLVYVSLATSVPGIIVTEASLAWLGFFDPTIMSWGRMLYDVQNTPAALENWWWVIPPGLAIALIALSFILLGYALDEILNPRLRMRR